MMTSSRQKISLGAVVFLLMLSSVLLVPLRTFFTDADVDVLLSLRGDRDVSKDVLLVYIDSQDIESLGGWPITRDYYGYLIHVLHNAGARVIALDVLFSTENSHYPEYDKDLSHFARIAGNVCLPFAFSHLADEVTLNGAAYLLGDAPHYPFAMLESSLAGMGFGNLADETVARHSLLAAVQRDSVVPSLGLECARQFLFGKNSKLLIEKNRIIISADSGRVVIPTDARHRIRLNHFGALDRLQSMSLIDLFQTYQKSPDSLHVQGKLVFIGVIAPGAAPIKTTPLLSSFPATLIHLTAAENIIAQNYIRTPSALLLALIILIFIAATIFCLARQVRRILIYVIVICVYILGAVLLFKLSARALPLLQPLFASLLSAALLLVLAYRNRKKNDLHIQKQYANEISSKEQQLADARKSMQQLKNQMADEKARTAESDSAAKQQLETREKEIAQLQKELRDMNAAAEKAPPVAHETFPNIIRASKSPLNHVLDLVIKVAPNDIPVLISGETGAGKEMIAQAIHTSGSRAGKPFIAVNCGALPETLLESELFGHEKGAFTGASSRRLGRFELADNGTLFLDEITETSVNFQAKLLRVLQENTFERLGGEKTIHVNVRIITASSKNIAAQVATGLFREDLFYRLNGFPIDLPPLRDRRHDIPLLAHHFLEKYQYEKLSLSEHAMQLLQNYGWPGNVREVENVIRRAAILAQSDGRNLIQEIDLPHSLSADLNGAVAYRSFDEHVLETLRALKFTHSSINQAAKTLGEKDRGTITGYFRGLCFQHLVNADFDIDKAAATLAGCDEPDVISRVKAKINHYLDGAKKSQKREAAFKGLPKIYHPYLDQIIKFGMSGNS